jgi:diadenosine tetraphosphate (Ap4A) HIT family hydrolase
MNASHNCPFCEIVRSDKARRIIAETEHAFAIRDGYPISEGHTLLIPKRHFASFFDATDAERLALLHLLEAEKQRLDKELSPNGYNIGINDGTAAGQTVSHLHIHLIPRYVGDVEDPRGGIRLIMPHKAKYWD